jgi:hypothetical protein
MGSMIGSCQQGWWSWSSGELPSFSLVLTDDDIQGTKVLCGKAIIFKNGFEHFSFYFCYVQCVGLQTCAPSAFYLHLPSVGCGVSHNQYWMTARVQKPGCLRNIHWIPCKLARCCIYAQTACESESDSRLS